MASTKKRFNGVLAQRIAQHWKQFRPRMYGQLVRAGTLHEEVNAAGEMTLEAVTDLIVAGNPPHVAWELVQEEWAFLPSEEGLPDQDG